MIKKLSWFLVSAVSLSFFFAAQHAFAQTDYDSLQTYGINANSRADEVQNLIGLAGMNVSPTLSGVDPPPLSAQSLVALCNDSSQQDTCHSYIRGHVSEILSDASAGAWSDFCPPPDTSDDALEKLVLSFIASDPRVKQLALSPADSVSLAFLEASKCQK